MTLRFPRKRRLKRTREREWQIQLAKGEKDFQYFWDPQRELLLAFAVAELSGSRIRINYPVARLYVDGKKRMIMWTESTLRKALRGKLQEIRDLYGGPWSIRIEQSEVVSSL
ncbi:MAG: hypothetical protein GY934_20625 [Gammaproteobacteria bacterium]|nr:hypothetical protein [Gammaproteobacteria bacterium]